MTWMLFRYVLRIAALCVAVMLSAGLATAQSDRRKVIIDDDGFG